MVASATLFAIHVGGFGVAAIACFASLARVGSVEDVATRHGLAGLLVLSGAWAATHVAYFLAPTPQLQVIAYVAGLVVGFGAVWAWLYFCSAYTKRTFHRGPIYRWLGVGVFVLATLVKVTNPIHGAYFTTQPATEPFQHVAIQVGVLHWTLMALSYALAFVGYFMILELLERTDYDPRPFLALLALTAAPFVLDLLSPYTPLLVDITYEPLGVAVFGVGVTVLYFEYFEAVRISAEREEPTLLVDDDGLIRELNAPARRLFADRDPTIGVPLETALPAVASVVDGEAVLEIGAGDRTRYYRVNREPAGSPHASMGWYLVCEDVTSREEYRRELERQIDRLESFATIVSHDLRNPLGVAKGRLQLAREGDTEADEDLAAVAHALDRMEALIEDVLAVARGGQPVDAPEPVVLSAVLEQCWGMVATGDATLEVVSDLRFEADRDRVQRLFENLIRNAIEHGSPPDGELTIRAGRLDHGAGFFVEDDGTGIPEADRDEIFETGYTTASDGTGFGLAIVSEIAEAHGWSVAVSDSTGGGARFEVRGVNGEPVE